MATPRSATAGPTACSAAGITYRQLDYWARTGLVEPSVRAAHGSGSQRLYGFRDILVLKVVKRLLDSGISLQQIRAAVQHLRDHGTDDLAQVTLMSDGVSVYECTSAGRGLRPAGGRPGRLRHRARPGLAGGRGRARRASRGPRRGRPDRRQRRQRRRAGQPPRGPEDRVTRSSWRQAMNGQPSFSARGTLQVPVIRPGESLPAPSGRAPKGQNFPRTSQAPRTGRTGESGADAVTDGESGLGRLHAA